MYLYSIPFTELFLSFFFLSFSREINSDLIKKKKFERFSINLILEEKKTFSTGIIILTVRSQKPHAAINHENIKLKQRQQPFT